MSYSVSIFQIVLVQLILGLFVSYIVFVICLRVSKILFCFQFVSLKLGFYMLFANGFYVFLFSRGE